MPRVGTWYCGRKISDSRLPSAWRRWPSPNQSRPACVTLHSSSSSAYSSRDLPSEIGGDSVADLDVLLGSASTEEVVVWECLETCGFPDRDAPALARIGMNEIVAVLRDVTGDRAARLVAQLNSKAIPKLAGLPIRVLGRKLCREVRRLGGATHRRRERRSEEIARQVVGNMSSGLIVGQSAQLLIDDPLA